LRKIGFVLIVPLMAILLLLLSTTLALANYQSQHQERIFTGISVLGVDLSKMTPAEAELALSEAVAYPQTAVINFTDPADGRQWAVILADLGFSFDVSRTVTTAYDLGRSGSLAEQAQTIFNSWYYGRAISPLYILD